MLCCCNISTGGRYEVPVDTNKINNLKKSCNRILMEKRNQYSIKSITIWQKRRNPNVLYRSTTSGEIIWLIYIFIFTFSTQARNIHFQTIRQTTHRESVRKKWLGKWMIIRLSTAASTRPHFIAGGVRN